MSGYEANTGNQTKPVSEIVGALAELRSRGWTYSAIADEIDVHRNTVTRWGSGQLSPASPAIVADMLAAMLDISPPPSWRRGRTHTRRDAGGRTFVEARRLCHGCRERRPVRSFHGDSPVCKDCRRSPGNARDSVL